MTIADTLIERAVALEWSRISASDREATQQLLHDTLSVGVAGARAPGAEAIRRTAAGWGASKEAGVLGVAGFRLPAAHAAFVNAFQIHAQEFDCVHEPAVVHPMATIAAAVMAEVERSGPYRGEDVLAAIAAGVEVAAGLGIAARSPLKFFRPATAGIFGCVTALSRLKHLDPSTARNAFGFALSFASGTMQAHVEGKAALPVQIAAAARSSLQAVDLACAGLEAAHASIEGPFGYLSLFETAADPEALLASFGPRLRVAEVSYKPFPTGRAAHGAIVATQALVRDHGINADSLRELVYHAPPLIKRLVGRPIQAQMQPAYARLCFPYLGAVVLTYGTVGLADFTRERLDDPVLHERAQRFRVVENGNPDPAAFVPARAIATLRDGSQREIEVSAQLGSPERPLTHAEHRAKSRACLEFAGHGAIDAALADLIERLDTLADARDAMRLACQGAGE